MNTSPPSRTHAAIALLAIVGVATTVGVLAFLGPESTPGRVVIAILGFLAAPFFEL